MTQLSLADICKLQYQLSQEEEKIKSITSEERNENLKNQTTTFGTFNYSNDDLIRIDLSRGRMTKPFYENSIDPIEYIKSGELVLFPNKKQFLISGNELIIIKSQSENNETLTSGDLIEYYRAFPNFSWSRYPHLYDWIMNNLTKDEHESVLKLMSEYKSFHQKEKQFMTDYRKFVSQFSLNEWVSEMFNYFFTNSSTKSEKTKQFAKSKQRKDSSTAISREFMQYIFPYVSLLGIFWILRKLFQLLKR